MSDPVSKEDELFYKRMKAEANERINIMNGMALKLQRLVNEATDLQNTIMALKKAQKSVPKNYFSSLRKRYKNIECLRDELIKLKKVHQKRGGL